MYIYLIQNFIFNTRKKQFC